MNGEPVGVTLTTKFYRLSPLLRLYLVLGGGALNLLILGAGEHGRVIKEIAVSMGAFGRIEYLDDNAVDAIGKLSDYENFTTAFDSAFVAIGNPVIRKELFDKLLEVGYTLPVLVHPTAYVSTSARISDGTVVMPKAIVQANTKIGCGCIISAGTIIDHNAVIGDYCHINAGAIIPARSVVPDSTKVDYGEIWREKYEFK